MKRVLIFIVTIFISFLCFGCGSIDKNDLETRNVEEMEFKVEKILLSKSFQSTDQSIEVINKGKNTKLVLSLGLTESSGVEVGKIIRRDNEINIHVSSIYDDENLQLAVPQVTLEIEKPDFTKIKDFKFNIVYDDFKPLKIKIGLNEVLSKIQSHFKISANASPHINLTKSNDNIIWDIFYDTIFDRDNPKVPLVSLSVSIDANSGDVLESKKIFISSSIDHGHVLSYIPNNYLLYKKPIENSSREDLKEQLWAYDLSSGEKSLVFSSNFKIHSAKYSPNLSYLSIIETSNNGAELYIVPKKDQKAYKICSEIGFNPKIMEWKDDNNLYLIEHVDQSSFIYSYNVEQDITDKLAQVNSSIDNLIIEEDIFLIVEAEEKDYNKKISSTSDWKNFNFIDYGFNPKFIGRDKLAYLQKDEKLDSNSLCLYDIRADENIHVMDGNISTFQIHSKENISYVKNNPSHNNFTLSKYSLEDKDEIHMATLISDKVYYDTKREIVYANITLPFEHDKPEMIYLIDLSKLN